MDTGAGLGGPERAGAVRRASPFGLAAERLATFAMGVALVVAGRGVRAGQRFPRWLAGTGTATGLINVAVAVLFSETSQVMYIGQGIIVAWLAAVAVVMLVL